MNIKITADSTCDLSKAQVSENEIELFPLYITKDGKSFRDGVDIFPADIVAHVAAGGDLCGTSAVNVGDYAERFAVLSAQYDGVIHISLGSGFSSAYQNACIAAADYPNIRVIDSGNLSTGQGHIVMEACRLRPTAEDLDVLADALRDLVPRVETSFLLNRLDYMVKGGRCSAVAAFGANLLQLRPSIEVKDGKMTVSKKYRGSFGKCLEAYIKDRVAERDDILRDFAFFTYSETEHPENVERAWNAAVEYGDFRQMEKTKAGCTITCHCGPDCLGILFLRKKENS